MAHVHNDPMERRALIGDLVIVVLGGVFLFFVVVYSFLSVLDQMVDAIKRALSSDD